MAHYGVAPLSRPPFVIVGTSAVVEHVDLYAYVSMVVAAMQVQEKEIADLRRQLEEAREPVCAVKAPMAVELSSGR